MRPVEANNSSSPDRSTNAAVWATARRSNQMSASWTGDRAPSTATTPSTWLARPIASMPPSACCDTSHTATVNCETHSAGRLFRPSAVRMAHRNRRRRRRSHRACFVDENGLDALRADVHPDDVPHQAESSTAFAPVPSTRAPSLSASPVASTAPAAPSRCGRVRPSQNAATANRITQPMMSHGNQV